METKFVAYYRVSTEKQGRSGLGLDAQKTIINYFAKNEIEREFIEVYSGKDLSLCEQLQKAVDYCIKNKCKLILAKSDRFRDLREALEIMDKLGDGNLICCDIPNADRFTYQLFFAIAERERMITSLRTKAALSEYKKRGGELGMKNKKWGERVNEIEFRQSGIKKSVESRKKKAAENENNKMFKSLCFELKIDRLSNFNLLSDTLNRIGCKTSSGLEFNPQRAKSMYNNNFKK